MSIESGILDLRKEERKRRESTMGVYTYIGKTLGMKVNSNMRKIREQYMQEGTIEKKDFAYLINNAARFDTIKNRLAERSYQVTEDFNDQKFELDDLMGNIITELSCLNYLDLNEKQEYHVKLSRTFMIGGSRLSIEDLMKEVGNGHDEVRLLQENFDANGDDITVVGTFDSLLKDYRLDVSVTADMKKEELKAKVRKMVKARLEEEVTDLQKNIAQLSN